LNREEAMTVLKKLVFLHLVEASWVAIGEREKTRYQLEIKCDCQNQTMQEFLVKNNLALKEDKARGICFIYKP
jgi:hypothetical protein